MNNKIKLMEEKEQQLSMNQEEQKENRESTLNLLITLVTDEEIYAEKRLLVKKPLPLESKKDHIKQIFSTLNFKTKPSTYTDTFGKYIIIEILP